MADQFPEPPELDEILRGVRKQLKPLVAIAVLLLAGLTLTSVFYSVGPDEEAVILRFGKFIGITQPGLHSKLPFGVDRVFKVKTRRIHKAEFGFRTEQAGIQTRYSNKSFAEESLMLTGDLNVADVEWIVQFKISDPQAFLFNVRNVEKNIRDIAEASMRLVVGDRSVHDVLTVGRAEIGSRVQEVMQTSIDDYRMGIRVVTVKLQDVNPPNPVKPSFNEVNAAKQEQEKMINEARRAYNKAVPVARGEAQKVLSEAQGYALERVNRSRGDADRFDSVYAAYRAAPAITRTRLYLESMEEIIEKVDRVVVADPRVRSMIPLLNLEGVTKGGAK